MPLVLNLDVRWRSGRLVHVRCRMMPMIGYRSTPSDGEEEDELPLDPGDVASLESFKEYLRKVTRISPNDGHVRIIGFQREIGRILELLDIEGPPPNPIPIPWKI
jgi:hypothetical protein